MPERIAQYNDHVDLKKLYNDLENVQIIMSVIDMVQHNFNCEDLIDSITQTQIIINSMIYAKINNLDKSV